MKIRAFQHSQTEASIYLMVAGQELNLVKSCIDYEYCNFLTLADPCALDIVGSFHGGVTQFFLFFF